MDPDFPKWVPAPLRAVVLLIPESYPLLRIAIIPQSLLLVASFVLMKIFGLPMPSFGCQVPLWHAVLMVLGAELAVLVSMGLLRRFFEKMKLPGYIERLTRALRKTRPRDLMLACAMVGFCEELFFRGVLVPLMGPLLGAILFGLAHRPRAPIHWLALTTLGMVFAWETRVTGGLVVPILHHALHDLAALSVLHVALKQDPDLNLFKDN